MFRASNWFGPRVSQEVRELHRLFPPIDLHADTLMWAMNLDYDMGLRHQPFLPRSAFGGHVDLPRLKEVNVQAQFFSVAVSPHRIRKLFRVANRQLDCLRTVSLRYPDHVEIARTAGEVYAARASGKVAAIISMEGAHFLEGSLDNLRWFVGRGLRSLGLVHLRANAAGFPNYGLGSGIRCGLSEFGRDLVGACNDLGVIVDLAHSNRAGLLEACSMTRYPVIVSHTGIHGSHPHKRNIDNQQLRAVADTGGIVGVIYEPRYLGGKDVQAVLRHLRHAINIVGEEHVALGSDWDGMIVPVRGLEHVGRLGTLTQAMLDDGWSYRRIGRVLCQNVLRVLRDVKPI